MTMSVTITCDGCGLTEEASTVYEAGVNEIDGVLDDGWTHGIEDFCPSCANARA